MRLFQPRPAEAAITRLGSTHRVLALCMSGCTIRKGADEIFLSYNGFCVASFTAHGVALNGHRHTGVLRRE